MGRTGFLDIHTAAPTSPPCTTSASTRGSCPSSSARARPPDGCARTTRSPRPAGAVLTVAGHDHAVAAAAARLRRDGIRHGQLRHGRGVPRRERPRAGPRRRRGPERPRRLGLPARRARHDRAAGRDAHRARAQARAAPARRRRRGRPHPGRPRVAGPPRRPRGDIARLRLRDARPRRHRAPCAATPRPPDGSGARRWTAAPSTPRPARQPRHRRGPHRAPRPRRGWSRMPSVLDARRALAPRSRWRPSSSPGPVGPRCSDAGPPSTPIHQSRPAARRPTTSPRSRRPSPPTMHHPP